MTFHDPVQPDEIVARIAEFDISFNLIAPTTFNYRNALPNKFLESIMAGHATIIGPSPSMAAVIEEWGNGLIASSFEAVDLAATLNAADAEDWTQMRANAVHASRFLNAEVEMGKVVDLYERLLGNVSGSDDSDSLETAAHA